MFTGIVSAVGRIAAADRRGGLVELTIEAPYRDLVEGESIAVQGACLTVTAVRPGAFQVQCVDSTIERTLLGEVGSGGRVNLERAVRAGEPLGGHLVQGHVDGVGTVVRLRDASDSRLIDVRVPAGVAEVTVLHGSITVDGVSLTVNSVPEPGVVQISLIPYTIEHTTLGTLQVGDRVHVEADVIGKYLRQLIAPRQPAPSEATGRRAAGGGRKPGKRGPRTRRR